ncbi:DUF559 domain-containing protein [Mesorhizobium sp. M8A.F.Ca.ET.173.01.1.1]|nr:DUF559 domain-containing protein [Mesorhizobium sp. M8A.F.Ca.ET.173.01.1.1]
MTEAEGRLWQELRDRRLDGIKFRRQVPSTRGEGRGAGALQSQTGERCNEAASGGEVGI